MRFDYFLHRNSENLKRNELVNLFLILFLPNIFFLILSLYTLTSRPLLNIDYFLAVFFILIPFRCFRYLGLCIYAVNIFFDLTMFLVQIFPFMDLSAMLYLIKFIPSAPINYIFLIILFSFLLVLFYIFLFDFSKNNGGYNLYMILLVFLLFFISYFVMVSGATYHSFKGILGRDNYYYVNSQFFLYKKMHSTEFSELINVSPRFSVLDANEERAANYLKNTESSKILFIVAESWGILKNSEAQSDILKNIINQNEKYEFIRVGSLTANGATVEGELRELCNTKLENNGFALSRLDQDKYLHCMPHKFLKEQYNTVALHATSGLLYDRVDWYSKAGFEQVMFGENLMGLKRCSAFKGVCDEALFGIVSKKFRENLKNKLFFYWMTLTTHQPYARRDIFNHRFNCKKFGMAVQGDICHYAKLHTQFFDSLAILLQRQEMKGVEVIVVGDHQPPIWGKEVTLLNPLRVGYLHLKVR